ncbi:MAG: DUF5668 domain-containing protein [Oscillospiraceae bacterium]
MRRNRRVGTLTCGVTLIIFGVAFIAYTFFPSHSALSFALNFWPVILIMLGLELIFSRFEKSDEGSMKIDFASIILMAFCLFFAFGCEIMRQFLTAEMLYGII